MMQKNIWLFRFMYLSYGLWFFSPLAVIYFKQITGSFANAMLAYSLISIAQCFLEIPCGLFSDRLSRKTNLIIGNIFLFFNMILWYLADDFSSKYLLFLGSILRGIGFAFRSGTITAMIYETSEDMKQEHNFNSILASIHSYYFFGNLFSAFFSAIIIYYTSLKFLVIISIIPFFIALILSFFLTSPSKHFYKNISLKKQIKISFSLLKNNKKLRNLALLRVFRGSINDSIFRFDAGYYSSIIPNYLINIARGIQSLMVWVSYLLVPKFKNCKLLKLLSFSILGSSLFRIIALLFNNTLTPFISAFQNIFYGTTSVTSTTLLQKEYNKNLRATLDSMIEFINGIILAIFGFLLGYLSDIIPIIYVMAIGVSVNVLISSLYWCMYKKYKD